MIDHGSVIITNIFWTGGMDSTFRLLKLLTTTSYIIQPHYIIRSDDSFTGQEIDTMIALRRMIVSKYPEVRTRFMPTMYTNEGLIPSFKEIDECIVKLKENTRVGDQYRFMSYYCRAFNISNIEVALVNMPTGHEHINQFISTPLFERFSFPIKHLTKKEMFEIAKENNWVDIINKTWFCHRPKKIKNPCGICGPCTDAIECGLSFRFPLMANLKARLIIPFKKYFLKNYLRREDILILRLMQKFERKI